MMKNFELFLLSFLLVAGFMTSCTNDEPVVQEPNTEDSTAITTSLSELSLQFNSQRMLNLHRIHLEISYLISVSILFIH